MALLSGQMPQKIRSSLSIIGSYKPINSWAFFWRLLAVYELDLAVKMSHSKGAEVILR